MAAEIPLTHTVMGHLTQIVALLEEDFSHLTISAPIQPVFIQSLISQKYTVNTFHNQLL